MKIIVSRYWRVNLGTLVAMETIGIIIILLTFLFFPSDAVFNTLLFGGNIIMMIPFQILLTISQRRFLGYVTYQNGIYTSYFLRKKLCTISENDSIFYAKIHGRISAAYYADFVLISKEAFDYCEALPTGWFRIKNKPLLVSYDMKKMILLPYEENAPYLSKMSQWTRIYPKANI